MTKEARKEPKSHRNPPPSFPRKRESIRAFIRLFVYQTPPCHVKIDSRFRGNDRKSGNDNRLHSPP